MINITNNFSHMSYCACVLYSNQIDWVIIDQGTYSLGEIHYTDEKIVCALLDWGKFYDLYLQNEVPYTFFNHFTYCEPASSSNQNDWYIIAQGKYSCREVHYKYEEHVGSITWCMSIWWFVISKSGNIYIFFLMPHIASNNIICTNLINDDGCPWMWKNAYRVCKSSFPALIVTCQVSTDKCQ